MKNTRFLLSLLLLAVVLGSTSFSAQAQRRFSPQAKGTVIGGGSGAILGAVLDKNHRAVGGVIGGIVGAGAGYALGKHVDNRQKKRAAATEAEREAAYRAAAAHRAAVASRPTTTPAPARETVVRNSFGPAAGAAGAAALVAAPAGSPSASNASYLPNQAPADPSNPYGGTAYRQRSW